MSHAGDLGTDELVIKDSAVQDLFNAVLCFALPIRTFHRSSPCQCERASRERFATHSKLAVIPHTSHYISTFADKTHMTQTRCASHRVKKNLYSSDTHVGAEVRHAKVESPPLLLLLRCECARCRGCVREQGQHEAKDARGGEGCT